MPVPALAGGLLFFARPKKSIQKKRPPDAACFLHSSVLTGLPEGTSCPFRQRAASLPHPLRAIPAKTSGTRSGIREWVIFIVS
ncbi:MAG: hypothetical protein HOO93_02250 [Methyloglobulus sp.]|nr:hypothetical protein [Methyloglobulus sp.]